MERLIQTLWLLGLLLSGCSFTTGNSFSECQQDVDCGPRGVCTQHYCLPLPEGCQREATSGTVSAFDIPERIPFGVLLPLTAPSDAGTDLAAWHLTAMRQAISEANSNKKALEILKGYRFGLLACDTSGLAETAATQAKWMVENARVSALVVSGDDETLSVAQEAARTTANAVVISPDATTDALAAVYAQDGNTWRVAPSDARLLVTLANRIKADYPDTTTRLGVAYATTQERPAKTLVSLLKAQGYSLIREERFDNQSLTEKTRMLTNLANFQPRATAMFAHSALDLRNLIISAKSRTELSRASGHRWYFSDAAKRSTLLNSETSPELDQATGVAVAQGTGGAFVSFQDSFKARTGVDPASYPFISHSYDALWLLMLAAATSPDISALSGSELKEGLSRLSKTSVTPIVLRADTWADTSQVLNKGQLLNVEGASSALDFSNDGSVRAPVELWQVASGNFQTLQVLTP